MTEPRTVLIVEDNLLFRRFLSDALSGRDPSVRVLEAGTLTEARQQLEAGRPGFVFLDVGLPDGNGLDLLDNVRGCHAGTCVAVCSANDTIEYREEAFRRGAAYFFAKQNLVWDDLHSALEGANRGPARALQGL